MKVCLSPLGIVKASTRNGGALAPGIIELASDKSPCPTGTQTEAEMQRELRVVVDPIFADRSESVSRDRIVTPFGDYSTGNGFNGSSGERGTGWGRVIDTGLDILGGFLRRRTGGGGGSYVENPPDVPWWTMGKGGVYEREPPLRYKVGYKRRRRVNPCNQKALRRALNRLCSFQRMVDRTWMITSSMGPRRRKRGVACPPKKRGCK